MDFPKAINSFHRMLGRSRLATAIAVKARNQCHSIISYHIHPEGIQAEDNGEAWLVRVLAPLGKRFIDVGANVGEWTELVLGSALPGRKLLLFEPAESAIKELDRRFSQVQGLEIIRAAVGDKIGIFEFYEEPEAGQTSSLVSGHSNREAIKKDVQVTTIDAEVAKQGWEKVDILKIDTEGYDFHVICGASNLLCQQRIGVIQFEYNAPWAAAGTTLAGARALFNKFGYQVLLLRASGLHPLRYDFYQEYFGYSNFVAVSPEALHVLGPFVKESV